LRYLLIGGIVFVVDVGAFQLFLLTHLYVPLATTLSYGLAVVAHFTLNKFFNFKNFERSTLRQFRTYLLVVAVCWLITMLVIQIGINQLGLTPLQAKLIAVIVNIPIGFICHKYLTFGTGVRTKLRQLQRSRVRR
jgi:putative flippase GtrA